MKQTTRKPHARRVRASRPGLVTAWLDAVNGTAAAMPEGRFAVAGPDLEEVYNSRSALFADAAYNVAVLHEIGVLRHSKVVER